MSTDLLYSLRQGLDGMPDGVCFSKDGKPVLINAKMKKIMQTAFDSGDCDASAFEKLCDIKLKDGCRTEKNKDSVLLLLSDGSAWNIKTGTITDTSGLSILHQVFKAFRNTDDNFHFQHGRLVPGIGRTAPGLHPAGKAGPPAEIPGLAAGHQADGPGALGDMVFPALLRAVAILETGDDAAAVEITEVEQI